MDSRKKSFLTAVVGDDGARALAKAADLGPDVEWAVFPRAVLSWLGVVTLGDEWSGDIPGTRLSLSLTKREGTFTGSMQLSDGTEFSFSDKPLVHVASGVLLAVGGTEEPAPPLESAILARLGKSIDLLVRSRTLRRLTKTEPRPRQAGLVRVPKELAQSDCPTCGGSHFRGGSYRGCACFTGLAKSVRTEDRGDHYLLTLGSDWTEDDRLTLAEGFAGNE